MPVWGDGTASREFLYVDDAAEGLVLMTERYDSSDPVNLGSGREIMIRDLAHLIADLTRYRGRIELDPTLSPSRIVAEEGEAPEEEVLPLPRRKE